MAQHSVKRTALSAGLIVKELLEVPQITEKVTNIVSVFATSDMETPYIAYRRVSMPVEYTKQGAKDVAQLEVAVYGGTYKESVDLAEAVRDALEGMTGESQCGLALSRCSLVDASEDWGEGAFIQILIFNVEI